MNIERFIASRIRQEGSKANFSTPIFRISITAISLGMVVMLLTLSIVNGFKHEIVRKISGISGHLSIGLYAGSDIFDEQAFESDLEILEKIEQIDGVVSMNSTASLGGIIKANSIVQGALFKGVSADYHRAFFETELIDGICPIYVDTITSNDILISSALARKLELKVGQSISVYFILERVRARKFLISGIFDNNLEDFNQLIYCDIKHIQKLKSWDLNQVGTIELFIDNYDQVDQMGEKIDRHLGTVFLSNQSFLEVETVKEKYPLFFNWISLFDTNTTIIIFLMLLVAIINIISGLLIMILERTNMIGILKSMGATDKSIRQIFIYHGASLTLQGLLFGNIIGLSLAFIQNKWELIQLNPASYYVDAVPILINYYQIIWLNFGAAAIILSSLLLPSLLVSRISPTQAIRFA